MMVVHRIRQISPCKRKIKGLSSHIINKLQNWYMNYFPPLGYDLRCILEERTLEHRIESPA